MAVCPASIQDLHHPDYLQGDWMSLRSAFMEYEKTVHAALQAERKPSSSVLELANELEKSDRFNELLRESQIMSRGRLSRLELSLILKRSGLYTDPHFDQTALLSTLQAWESEMVRVVRTHRLSLPWIDGGKSLDVTFGTFRLRHLPHATLERLLELQLRQSFYPNSIVSEQSILELGLEVWLECTDYLDVKKSGFNVDLSLLGTRVRVLDTPEVLDRGLRRILLLAWEEGYTEADWHMWFPGLPVGTLVSQAMHERPRLPQRLGVQAYEYVGDDDPDVFPFAQLIQQVSTADLRELPRIHEQVEWAESQPQLGWAVRALDLFVRASTSQAYRWTGKLDQFLYHVFALDAALSQNGREDCLVDHVLTLMQYNQADFGTTDLKSVVRDLYRLRSEIVHGKAVGEIPTELSWEARRVARSILRAVLRLLHENQISTWRDYKKALKSL